MKIKSRSLKKRVIILERGNPEPFTVRHIVGKHRFSTVRSADAPVRPHGQEAQPGRP